MFQQFPLPAANVRVSLTYVVPRPVTTDDKVPFNVTTALLLIFPVTFSADVVREPEITSTS